MTNPNSNPVPTGPAGDLSALIDQLSGITNDTGTPDDEGDKPVFGDLDEFVRDYLTQVVERRVALGAAAGITWCPRWWLHPEAISRFYALWRAWETLRVSDPQTGMSIWWRDHLDPHLNALTSEYGPLSRCGPDRGHVDPVPLPTEPAPHEVLAQLPDHDS